MAGTSNAGAHPEGNGGGNGWVAFCDVHARASAFDFAKAFCNYVAQSLPESARATLSHRDFLRKFVETFCEHFESEYMRRSGARSGLEHDGSNLATRASSHDELSDVSEQEGPAEGPPTSPKASHKPFFRRLSFKGLRKGSGLLFHHKQQQQQQQQQSPEDPGGELSRSERRREKSSKAKLSKIVVECRKEGVVNSLMGENMDGTLQKWEKSRLALIKAIGGYMLELYSPPKAVKPRSGVFCSDIIEARETTALEMPDHENTFVLKTQESELIIEAHDPADMKSWLATIRYCMRSGQLNAASLSLGHSCEAPNSAEAPFLAPCDGERGRANSASKGCSSSTARAVLPTYEHHHPPNDATATSAEHLVTAPVNPPELPPRLRAPSSGNLDLCSSQQEIEQLAASEAGGADLDLSSSLREYAWFHGTLPRSDAAQLVLHSAAEGHGVFLVRQSETRKGEFVLTFNFQGRAKHLRMTLNEQGHCRVQHLCFPTINDMLEHFRKNAIPLESGGTADVTLTEYVVANTGPPRGNNPGPSQSAASREQLHQERRPAAAAPEQREIQTYGGSIRTRVESLERLEQQNAAESQQDMTSGRAVQNAYSFL